MRFIAVDATPMLGHPLDRVMINLDMVSAMGAWNDAITGEEPNWYICVSLSGSGDDTLYIKDGLANRDIESMGISNGVGQWFTRSYREGWSI